MNAFELLVSNLNQLGFFGFLLPWLLMFAVVYGLLLKSKALGENQKIIGVVALVAAFFVVGYGGPLVGTFFQNLFGIAAMILGGIIVIVLFVSMAGGDITKLVENKAIMALIAGVGIIVLVVALGTFGVKVSSDVAAAIFMVIVMAIAVYFIAGK
jgi:hypothetical protein